MYKEVFVHDSERITDPIKFAEGNLELLLKFYCKRGLLKVASKRELKHRRRPYSFAVIGKRVYSVRSPANDDEDLIVNELQQLDAQIRHFSKCYTGKQFEDAIWDAFEIGALRERIDVLHFAAEVGAGRKVTAGGRNAHEKTHGTPAEKRQRWARYQAEINHLILKHGWLYSKAVLEVGERNGVNEKTIRRHTHNPTSKKS